MTRLADRDLSAALCDFLIQIGEDARNDSIHTLPEYLARFPGCEPEVAREYLSFVDGGRSRSPLSFVSAPDDALFDDVAVVPGAARYEVVAEIGRGGMGTVERVLDLQLGRELARKVILRDGVVARRRFLEEAHITGLLDHPGVVPVHELGRTDDGRPYFTMRFVEGLDFEQVIERVHAGDREHTLARALDVVVKVCDTMAFAHSRGVVHRDLKPANVRVGRFGEAYVMDWGLARRMHSDDPRADEAGADHVDDRFDLAGLVTLDGDVLGTPAYMSPEQALGHIAELGPRSDVYAVGALLYQLLTGTRPYSRPNERVPSSEMLVRVREGPPDPVRKVRHDARPELAAIAEKAMARDPLLRYADMSAMGHDLRAYLDGRVVAAHRADPLTRVRKWVARNRLLATLGSVLLLVAVVAFVVIRSEQKQSGDRLVQLSSLQLESMFDTLWPPQPESVPAIEQWLAEARAALAKRAETLAAIAELKGRALPINSSRPAEMKQRADLDDMARQRISFLEDLHAMLVDYDRGINRLPENQTRSWLVETIRQHEALRIKDPKLLVEHKTFEFADRDDQRTFDALQRLAETQKLFEGEPPRFGLVRLAEWGLVISRSIRRYSIDEAHDAWRLAIASISNPKECPMYRGLVMPPQLGLVPIGRDRHSGLWEFAHVASGRIPERDALGELAIDENTCVVLVLVPGGTIARGSQSRRSRNANLDPWADNYDPWADVNAPFADEIELVPFFMAKHELTQAQWLRVTGRNPSGCTPSTSPLYCASLLHPVENMVYDDARRVARVMGLSIPTEAQWEYAARAGTHTPWPQGVDPCALAGAANLADRSAARARTATREHYEEFFEYDDGWPVHSPVGSFPANAFGLHDMIGNVREWCRDRGPFTYESQTRALTGERIGVSDGTKVVRGGSWWTSPTRARSASRDQAGPEMRSGDIGVRLSREVQP